MLKNETINKGDLYIEGSQSQLKSLLKKHIAVKPACLLDSSLQLNLKVMYALQGQYSEAHTRSVSIDLAQIAVDQPKYDH